MMIHKHVPMPEVLPCVTQVYPSEGGTWWRYCLTCDDGSNKYGRHRRGHKTEDDAQMSARDHAKKAAANRQWRAWMVLWEAKLLSLDPDDWTTFVEVYEEKTQYYRLNYPRIQWDSIPEEKRRQLVLNTQDVYRRTK